MSLHAKIKAQKRRAKKRETKIFSYKRKEKVLPKYIEVYDESLIKNEIPQIGILIKELRFLKKDFNINDFFKKIDSRIRSNIHWNSGIESDQIGILSEFYIELCLEILKSRGKIADFLPTPWKGDADKKGVDFQIILITEKKYITLRLQVKSSKKMQKKHIKRNKGESIQVPSIVASPYLRTMLKKMEKIIVAKKNGKTLHL